MTDDDLRDAPRFVVKSITLTESLWSWLCTQAHEGGFEDSEHYLIYLLRKEQLSGVGSNDPEFCAWLKKFAAVLKPPRSRDPRASWPDRN